MQKNNFQLSTFNFQLIVILLLIVLMPCISYAQADQPGNRYNTVLDSLLRIEATAKQDTNLVKLYSRIHEVYLEYDVEKADEYIHKCKTLSEKLNWSTGRYLAIVGRQAIFNRKGLVDSSLVVIQEGLELAKKENNVPWIVMMQGNLAIEYYYQNWYQTALQYIMETIPLVEKMGESEKANLAALYSLTSNIYAMLHIYDESLMYIEKALSITEETADRNSRGYFLKTYAEALVETQQLEKAKDYALEAERIYINNNSNSRLSTLYNLLGEIAFLQNDLSAMEIYLSKEMKARQEYPSVYGFAYLANAARLEMRKGNLAKAEELAKTALEKSIETDWLEFTKNIYRILADISNARHNFHQATIYATKSETPAWV